MMTGWFSRQVKLSGGKLEYLDLQPLFLMGHCRPKTYPYFWGNHSKLVIDPEDKAKRAGGGVDSLQYGEVIDMKFSGIDPPLD